MRLHSDTLKHDDRDILGRLGDLFLAWLTAMLAVDLIGGHGWQSAWTMLAVGLLVASFALGCKAVQARHD